MAAFIGPRKLRAESRFVLSALLIAGACAPARVNTPAAPILDAAQASISDRLYFGRAVPGGGTVSDESYAHEPSPLSAYTCFYM